jgi:hypothetical protein
LQIIGTLAMTFGHSELWGWTIAAGVTNFFYLLLSTFTFALVADVQTHTPYMQHVRALG